MYKPTADEIFEAELNMTYRQDLQSQLRVQQHATHRTYRKIADESERPKAWGELVGATADIGRN
jgi:hypothetical protein